MKTLDENGLITLVNRLKLSFNTAEDVDNKINTLALPYTLNIGGGGN